MFKKILASIATLALSVGLAVVTASPASATGTEDPVNSNHEDFWETPDTLETCIKIDHGYPDEWPVSEADIEEGNVLTKVIIKTGNTTLPGEESNPGEAYKENTAYFEYATYKYPANDPDTEWLQVDLSTETSFDHYFKHGISHVIYCQAPKTAVAPVAPTTTAYSCDASTAVETPGTYTIPGTGDAAYFDYFVNGDPTMPGTITAQEGVAVTISASLKAIYEDTFTLAEGATTSWGPYDLYPADSCEPVLVTPLNPVITPAYCTDPGQTANGTITPQAVTGIAYTISINGASAVPFTSAVSVAPGATYTVYASTTGPGYYFEGADSDGPIEVESGIISFPVPDCIVDVTPVPPTPVPPSCVGPQSPGAVNPGGYYFDVEALPLGVSYWLDTSPITSVAFAALPAGSYTIRAVADPGYEFPGDADGVIEFPFTIESDPDCRVTVTPIEPTPVQPDCVGPQAPGEVEPGGYFFDAESLPAGITYTLNGVEITSVEFGALPAGSYTMVATADAGYTFPGGVTSEEFDFTIDPDPDCLVTLPTLADVSFSDPQCVESEEGTFTPAFFEIEEAEHVTFQISYDDGVTWEPIDAGQHPAEVGDAVLIQAVADDSYELVGTTEWEHTFSAPICDVPDVPDLPDLPDLPLVTPVVTSTQATCTEAATYTLSNAQLFTGAISWTANGVPVTEGTHTVAAAGTVTIVATPTEGYGFAQIEGEELPQLTWTLEFVEPSACGDLETLALTGSSTMLALGLAGGLLVAGGLTLAARRRVELNG